LSGHSPVLSVAAVTPRLGELLDLSLKDGIVISQRIRQTEFRATDAVRGESVRIGGAERDIGSDCRHSRSPDWDFALDIPRIEQFPRVARDPASIKV